MHMNRNKFFQERREVARKDFFQNKRVSLLPFEREGRFVKLGAGKKRRAGRSLNLMVVMTATHRNANKNQNDSFHVSKVIKILQRFLFFVCQKEK